MATYLYRLGHFAARRRGLVLVAWLVVLLLTVFLAVSGGGKTVNDFTVPGTQSAQATALLQQRVPSLAGAQTQIVFATNGTGKVTGAAARAGIERALANLRKVSQVTVVSDPFQAKTVAPDGRAALAQVQYSASTAKVTNSTLDAVNAAVAPSRAAGLETQFSGAVYPGSTDKSTPVPELIGIILGFVILLITFGALVAGAMPILTALFGVVIAFMGTTALAAVTDVATVATSLAVMLGLATGIDYALFISLRHRSNILQGLAVEESVALAVGTAGSSVVFAAITLILALCGLSVVGIPFLSVMGLCAAGAVLISMLLALTLVPALLGFAGARVSKFLSSRASASARRTISSPEHTIGASWARFVVRFKVPLLLVGVTLLLVIASPVHDLQLGLPGASTQPTSNTGYKAYKLISASFGAGSSGPLVVVAPLTKQTSSTAPKQLVSILAREPDAASAKIGAIHNHTAIIQVIPRTGPNATLTTNLVNRIRGEEPALARTTGVHILVGGTTAANIDTSAKLSSALPVFLGVVVILAFLLLTFAFRTIMVPITSLVGFLLSGFAALGAEVAVIQWGWAKSLLNITPSETVSYIPIILLAIIFGLSGDYEVFVVSRIKEDFSKTGDAVGAVKRGTGASVRVVSAAALIMFCVFVAFLTETDPTIKAIGLGLAVGVFLDAFVVRLTLVPAVMALIKGKFWYHPQWFDKRVPDLDIEGDELKRPRTVHSPALPQG